MTGAVKDFSYLTGYITKEKLRDTESFRCMVNIPRGTGEQKGVAFAAGT
jgi:hypothetical protein